MIATLHPPGIGCLPPTRTNTVLITAGSANAALSTLQSRVESAPLCTARQKESSFWHSQPKGAAGQTLDYSRRGAERGTGRLASRDRVCAAPDPKFKMSVLSVLWRSLRAALGFVRQRQPANEKWKHFLLRNSFVRSDSVAGIFFVRRQREPAA